MGLAVTLSPRQGRRDDGGGVVLLNGWIAVGLVAAVAAVVLTSRARRLEVRAKGERPRTRAGRRARLQAEIASHTVLFPIAVCLFGVASMIPPPAVEHVSGKPVEMRSWSRLVVMPDGRQFSYCPSSRKHCPDLAAWDRLPRWPEPEHVEMIVSGHELYSLKMDGQVIADRPPAGDLRPAAIMIGLGLIVFASVTIVRRRVKLKKIPPPAPPRSPGRGGRRNPADSPVPGVKPGADGADRPSRPDNG
jgi:hypothetical protein